MKIILGSNNNSKKEAIELALDELGITNFNTECLAVPSNVSSKPINEETLIGAKNRNIELFRYCLENNIDYDYLISIEGGYEQIDEDNYFIVTYACTYDKKQDLTVFGKSQGLQISKRMFDWVKSGKSLNTIIENITDNKENKKKNGISGYLTDGYYYRSYFDSSAVITAFQCLKNQEIYKKLEKRL